MGRRSKLNDERQEAIVAAVEQGSWLNAAAKAAGIAESTLHDWLRRGEDGESKFSEFSEAVRHAEAKAELDAVACIRAAWQMGDWRAAFKFLERRFPEQWGERSRVQVTGRPISDADPGFAFLDDPEVKEHSRALVNRAAELREKELGGGGN